MFGQKCVIRILDTANTPYHVWDLQLPEWMFNEVQKACKADSGMVRVCGPTGSGKTSTLYAVIRDIDVSERNVVTIEDPVEIQLDGVTQIPVNEAQGNTFGALLRSVLRQDPDAILVGEVRDPETARIAYRPPSRGTWCFRPFTLRTRSGRSFDCWISALSRIWLPAVYNWSLGSDWCGSFARTARLPINRRPIRSRKWARRARGCSGFIRRGAVRNASAPVSWAAGGFMSC